MGHTKLFLPVFLWAASISGCAIDVAHRIYFCVYLGETADQDVSSAAAREIAVSLIRDNFCEERNGEENGKE